MKVDVSWIDDSALRRVILGVAIHVDDHDMLIRPLHLRSGLLTLAILVDLVVSLGRYGLVLQLLLHLLHECHLLHLHRLLGLLLLVLNSLSLQRLLLV